MTGEKAPAARAEALDRILRSHQLYCTVYDNNNPLGIKRQGCPVPVVGYCGPGSFFFLLFFSR